MAKVKGLTQCLPGRDIGEPQVSSREGTKSTGPCGYHAYRTAYDQSEGGPLAPGDSPLDMASRAKVLFQIIVGPREVFDLVAAEKSVPITVGDFAEVCHCSRQVAQLVLVLRHGCQQLLILLLEGGDIALLGISQ